MRIARISANAIAMFCLALAPAYAQKGKAGGAPTTHGNPHTTTAAQAPAPTTHGASATTHGPKTTTATTTTTTKAHGNPHTTATTPSGTSTGGANTSTSTTSATTGTGTNTGTTATTTTTTLNPIAQKLQGKPLGDRIEKMLLSSGMTLDKASSGFPNQGRFIAAVHVSQNLGIPFASLRATMLGLPQPGTTTTTTSSPMSLGQAIQKLKPLANATTEAAHAETQARTDLSTATTTTTSKPTSTATKTSKKKSD